MNEVAPIVTGTADDVIWSLRRSAQIKGMFRPSVHSHPIMSETSKTNPTEQHFNILPHPAVSDLRRSKHIVVTNVYSQKSNNPADLVDSGAARGLASNPAALAHQARPPHVPSQEVLNKLDAPLVRRVHSSRYHYD